MSDIWSELNKAFGTEVLSGTDTISRHRECILFPSFSLGDATHSWGAPLGDITQLMGVQGSGKTMFAMLMAKQAQQQYPGSIVIWADAEGSFDRKWAAQLGIDLDRLRIIEGNNGAEIFHLLCGKYNTTGKKIPGILEAVIAKKLDCKLVVLDSIASLIAPTEEGRNLDEFEMSSLARFLPKAFRVAKDQLHKAGAAMICINQARDAFGTRIPTLTYSGGRAYRHTLSVAITMTPSTAKENIIYSDAAETKKVGHKIIATVEKTRSGPDKHKAEFFLDFTKGVVKIGEEYAVIAAAYGIVNRPNNVMWEYKDLKVKGAENFYAALEAHPEYLEQIKKDVMALKDKGITRSEKLSDDTSADYAQEGGSFTEAEPAV